MASLAGGSIIGTALRFTLFVLPWPFYDAIFSVCWDCYDFEAGAAHEMGHLLGHHPQRRADRGGELLLSRVAPALRDVGDALDQVRGLREVAAGRLRINAPPPAVDLVLAPMVGPFLTAHPQVDLDIVSESGFVDIVSADFDAGVRYGEHLAISTNMSLAMRAARDGVGIW